MSVYFNLKGMNWGRIDHLILTGDASINANSTCMRTS